MNKELTDDAKEVAEKISDMANCDSGQRKLRAIAIELTSDHPYLQGETFRHLILPAIEAWARAGDTGRYNGENESTVKTCQIIRAALSTKY